MRVVVLLCLSVVLAAGSRPVPFRTRKLSLPAPMVLHPGGCGRVGHRRHFPLCVVGWCHPSRPSWSPSLSGVGWSPGLWGVAPPHLFLCPFPPLARAEGAGVWGSRASAQGKSRVTRGCGARDPPGGDESNGGAVGRGRRSPAPRPDAAAGTSVRPQCQYGVSMRRSSPVSGSVNARTFAVRPIGRLWSSSSMNGTYGSGSSRSCRATSLISA